MVKKMHLLLVLFLIVGLAVPAVKPVSAAPGIPVITITAPVAGETYEFPETLTIDFLVVDGGTDGLGVVTATLDGSPVVDGQVIDLFTLPLGAHVFTVNAVDSSGLYPATMTVNFTSADTAPPVITVTAPVANKVYEFPDTLTIDFSAVDVGYAGLNTVTATLDGAAVVDGQVIDLFTTPLGSHTFIVTAADKAGNTATMTVLFTTADTVPPEITITSPVAGAEYLHTAFLTLDFSAVDVGYSGLDTVEATLNGETVVDGQVIDLLVTLPVGPNTLTVTATDKAGNVATKSVTFIVTATIKSLMASVERFYTEGLIKPVGIKVSLLAKLKTAQRFYDRGNDKMTRKALEVFIHFVNVQRGKHIRPAAANLLIADAEWLLSNVNVKADKPKPKLK